MKMNVKKTIGILAATLLVSSCSLDEINKSALTSDNYFTNDAEFDELVSASYESVRTILRDQQGPMWSGTDIYEGWSIALDNRSPVNDYTTMSGYEFEVWWGYHYSLIARINQALTRGAVNGNLTSDFFALRQSELLALRAYCYFNLVESFGGVPLLIVEHDGPNYDLTRSSEEQVYDQIVADLTDALDSGKLPEHAEPGRVAQGFVNHLLAKVLLTRSYKTFAKQDDVTKAMTYAKKALELHPLIEGNDAWNILFGADANYNPFTQEVIFSVCYSPTDESYNSGGNNLYSHFKFNYDQFLGGGRTAPYWRCTNTFQPTTYFLNELYDETDVRGKEPFLQRTIFASAPAVIETTGTAINVNDPIIYFPKTVWSDQQKADYMAEHPTVYLVVNPDEYHDVVYPGNSAYPMVWKFYDPGVTVYDDSGKRGTRDTYVFRSAETLLLLAEAYIKQGNGGEATKLINKLRTRAGAQPLIGDATIDDVLDESARELFGEGNRWMELKRCGKLFERALKYNALVKYQHPDGTIPDFYLLRPIPLSEISVSQGTLKQNPSYPEE